MLAGREARAQQTAAADGPALQPPQVKTPSAAEYPLQALHDHVTGTVNVVLVLQIDAGGVVKEATVPQPQGHGFDEAAITAARALVFFPATRDGDPIAAKIKYAYEFKSPPPKLIGRVATQATDRPIVDATVTVTDSAGQAHVVTSGADGSWIVNDELPPGAVHLRVTAPGKADLATDDQLAPGEETSLTLRLAPSAEAAAPAVDGGADAPEDIVVRGERPPREVVKRTLGREEIEHIPGTNGDALRSLQNLPGVARPPALSGALIVRGSAPQDTITYIDGTPVPLIYHFGGLSSVVPTETLDKIDFYPGNFSSQYGRGMGGVVDVGLRDPRSDGYHAMAQADLIDLRAILEAPIGNTGWKLLVGGRRSWFDVYLGPILSATTSGVSTAPRYYDYQAILEHDIGSHSSFRLAFFGSDDKLSLVNQNASSANPSFGGDIGSHTSFWRLQARYLNKITSNTEVRVTAAYGQDSVDLGVGVNALNTTSHPFSTRAELSQKSGQLLTMNVGLDMIYEPYGLTLQLPPPAIAGQPSGGPGQATIRSQTSNTLFLPGMYAELEVKPLRGMRIVPGLRGDYDDATRSWDVSPRINARQDLTTGFPRTTLKGGAGIFYQPPQPLDTDPRFGQTGLTSNRSVHYDVGVEQEITHAIDVSVDTYYKSFSNLVETGSGNSGDGYAYGLEILAKYKPDKHWFGWISYTLSRSMRRTSPSAEIAPFEYDQPQVLTVLGSYKWGKGWQLGGRFRFVSGDLYTSTSYAAFNASTGSQLGVTSVPTYGTRLPSFYALDVRVDKVWAFARWKFSMYLDVQNLTNHQNAEGESYNFNYTQSQHSTGLPILPVLGMRGEF